MEAPHNHDQAAGVAQAQNIVGKKRKCLRGLAAAGRRTPSYAQVKRAEHLLKRMSMCWVCGKQFEHKPDQDCAQAEYRVVGAWTILACRGEHPRIGWDVTLNGRTRFFEVPPTDEH